MFNTLGNIETEPRVGLLFIDFDDGSEIDIVGRGRILWDDPRQSTMPGAERLLEIDVLAVEQRPASTPLRWRFESYSPVNPAAG
jgi:hypothetical protein